MPMKSPPLSHEDSWNLLPWLANNSLRDDELHGLLEHLKICSTCRDELRFLPELRLVSDQVRPDAPPSRAISNHLSSRIDAHEQSRRSWLQKAGERLTRRAAPGNGLPFLIAQAALIVLLVGGVWWTQPEEASFQTLSQATPAADSAHYLRLIFEGSTPADELKDLLLELEATVVSGPSSLGAYVVRLPAENDLGEVIRALRLRDEVTFAEPTPFRP